MRGFLKVKTSLSEDGIDYFVLKDDSFFTVDVCEGVKSRSPPVVALCWGLVSPSMTTKSDFCESDLLKKSLDGPNNLLLEWISMFFELEGEHNHFQSKHHPLNDLARI